MTTITIISLGTLKEEYWREALREYEKRLQPYCKLVSVQLKEEKSGSKNESAAIAEILRKEAQKIDEVLPAKAFTIAHCIEGKALSSEDFAKALEQAGTSGYSEIALIIGSSHGLSEEIKARADLKLSFSKMTFPHQLARVILAEQLYRAFQILSGGKYHK